MLQGEPLLFCDSLKNLWPSCDCLPGHPENPLVYSLVLCELCHLLSHLPALLSQLVECRNRQDLKYILDPWNVLTSCKFLVVNLVKESFRLPHHGYTQFLNAHILGIENLPSGLAQDCPSLHLLSKDNNTSPLSSQMTLFGQ